MLVVLAGDKRTTYPKYESRLERISMVENILADP